MPFYTSYFYLPQDPEEDLFPCFATKTPHALTTNAAAVLTLNESFPSPPVPTIFSKNQSSQGVFENSTKNSGYLEFRYL